MVTGGTSSPRQYLAKASATDYDTVWRTMVSTDLSDTAALMRGANNLSEVSAVDTARKTLSISNLKSAMAVAITNVASKSGTGTFDGVALVANDIILLTGQTTASENGPWVINAGAWTRPLDFPTGLIARGRNIQVVGGGTFAGTWWYLATTSAITVDTNNQTWTQSDFQKLFTTAGDLPYASASKTAARLAIGSAYQTLRTNAGATAPEWVSGGEHLIAETVLGASAASVDFTSIPATFRHLRVVWIGRSDRAGTGNDVMIMSVNNDTTNANYDEVNTLNSITASAADRSIAQLFAATSTASYFCGGYIDIPHYANTTTFKSMLSVFVKGAATNGSYMADWKSTAAISRLTFASANAANLIAGSRFALYGIG